jgi:hypothetical protein
MRRVGAFSRGSRALVVSVLLVVVLGAGALGCTAVPGTVGAPAGSATYRTPAAVPADCSRDVTGELVAWMESVPDGSTIAFPAGGCYRVDGTLRLRFRNNLTIDGNGSTFKAFTDGRELPPSEARTRSMWAFWRGSNLTLRETIVVGANPRPGLHPEAYVGALEAQTAYVVGGVDRMLIEHVQAHHVFGDFVFVGPRTRNLLVRRSSFKHNGRQGWNIAGGENITFDSNEISNTRRATIDMEPSSTNDVARNITFSNNQVGPGRLYFFASEGVAAPIDGVNIVNNRLTGKAMDMRVNPPRGTRSNYRVIGNYSDTRQQQGGGGVMAFSSVIGLEVRDNRQPVQARQGISGVSVRRCQNVVITGNKFLNAISPVYLRVGNLNVRHSGNLIGNPLVPAAPQHVAQT